MANFQMKIEEMQRKLNVINDDIEEIKNGRKPLDENIKIKINKNNTFFRNTKIKKKIFLRDNFSINSMNFLNQKNKNNSTDFLNMNHTGRTINYLKNTNFNLTNSNIEEIKKNNYYICEKINSSDINNNDISSKKEILKNYINEYKNKKNNNLILEKDNSPLNTINDNININNHFERNINSEKDDEKNDYQYKNSLYNDYTHMKKNLNDINMDNTNSINTNGEYYSLTINHFKRNKKTIYNAKKDINSISSIKRQRIKKILNENNNPINTNNRNLFNNEVSKKHLHKTDLNDNLYNNINHKTIDINYDYSYNNKNNFNDSDIKNINTKSNAPIKIKTRNINNNININNNNKDDLIRIKERNNTFEDINIKNPRSTSIQNTLNNHYKTNNRDLKIKDNHFFHDISHSVSDLINHYPKTIKNIKNQKIKTYFKYDSNINFDKKIESKYNHEQMLLDIIDVTNQYTNNENKANMNNIVDEYKLLLYDIKIKNEFIYKIINLYNNTTNSNLNFNDSESLIPTWNWIKNSQNNISYNNLINENESNQYKNLCKDIMKQYNLKNIQQLKMFIHKLCKKVDKNENFLEGIKKILLP